MKKKIFLFSLCTALTANFAFAETAPYVGAGFGITTNTSENGNFRGMPFNLFAGYGGVLADCYYIAGEFFVIPGTISFSDHGLKSTYDYGLSILPGLLLSDRTIVFVRGGVVRTRFNEKETKTGGQVGLGMQVTLTQNIDMRYEYDFSAYGSFNKKHSTQEPRNDTFNLAIIYKFD